MCQFKYKIHPSWKIKLKEEFNSDYFKNLEFFLAQEKRKFAVYPKDSLIFEAFNQTSFEKTKVVIIGQDPYHGIDQAHGLSFSVQEDLKKPPSLQNILKELKNDLGLKIPESGNLTKWSNQGVLMLNSVLTVREKSPGSHQKIGWEKFTDASIRAISIELKNVVFILWGKYAEKKGAVINHKKHYIIKSAHPSPFSANKGFFGSKPFSKSNDFLISKGIKPINWSLAD
jgi:uracil-DNA glycosylase